MRLVVAAMMMACRGVITLVPTTVAMELAVSWKPLIYSKARAMKITRKMMPSVMRGGGSGVLQNDLGNDIAGVAAAVDDLLEEVVEVALGHCLDGVHASGIDHLEVADHELVGA